MDKLLIAPFLILGLSAILRDARRVFILAYIPVLIILPVYYKAEFLPGTPELGFADAILVGIVAGFIIQKKASHEVTTDGCPGNRLRIAGVYQPVCQ